MSALRHDRHLSIAQMGSLKPKTSLKISLRAREHWILAE